VQFHHNFRKTCHLIEKERCLLQHVVTVVMNAKYHSDQKTTDLFIATNVSQIISHKIVEDLDLVEDQVTVEMIEVLGLEVQEMTDPERCLLQHVVTVVMNAKYHSDQKTIDLFIATNVSQIISKIKKMF